MRLIRRVGCKTPTERQAQPDSGTHAPFTAGPLAPLLATAASRCVLSDFRPFCTVHYSSVPHQILRLQTSFSSRKSLTTTYNTNHRVYTVFDLPNPTSCIGPATSYRCDTTSLASTSTAHLQTGKQTKRFMYSSSRYALAPAVDLHRLQDFRIPRTCTCSLHHRTNG